MAVFSDKCDRIDQSCTICIGLCDRDHLRVNITGDDGVRFVSHLCFISRLESLSVILGIIPASRLKRKVTM